MLFKLALALFATAANAECLGWCNPYTCNHGSCDTCATCTDLADGNVCVGWCNDYTCAAEHCTGCDGEDGRADHCAYLGTGGKRCLSWCNPYTCASHDTDCGACDGTNGKPSCTDVAQFCEGWCNEWTTSSPYCVGCD